METTTKPGALMADFNVFLATAREALAKCGGSQEELARFQKPSTLESDKALTAEIVEETHETGIKLREEAEKMCRDLTLCVIRSEDHHERAARFEAEGASYTEAELLEHEEASRSYAEFLQKLRSERE